PASMLAIARAAGQVNLRNDGPAGPPSHPKPSETRMPDARYDVIAIGNAIVDVMSPCTDELIEEFGMARGAMTLVDARQAAELYDAMGPAREISGGSAANT